MLGYIKGQIAARAAEITQQPKQDGLDDTTIVEYAHLFQELSDLSVDGIEENKIRPIEIPLDDEGEIEDDDFGNIELEEIGYNVMTGTLNVPADAAIQSEYAQMKTRDTFFEESYNLLRIPGESDYDFEERRNQFANDSFMQYRKQVLQEGMFGFNRIKVDSDRVPSFAAINFGKDGNSDYRVRMEIQHQVDKSGNLTRKQLESIYLAESCGLCEHLMPAVEKDLRNRYHISESANIWDNVIPAVFVAPVDPIYEHSIIVGFKNDENLSSFDFYRFANPVDKYTTDNRVVLEWSAVERLDTSQVKELSRYCMTKNAAIKEGQKENPRYHRVFQEAIDLGGGGDGNNNDVTADNQNAAPAGDNNDNANNNAAPDNKATIEVTTNDVSDQIANNVAAETQNQTPTDGTNGTDGNDMSGGDEQIPDISGLDNLGDGGSDDQSFTNDEGDGVEGVESTDMNMNDVDSQLAELNASGNEESALSDGDLSSGEIDIDNMSMDDLISQGTERLKSMSLGQLKEFLANNDVSAVQEAFILTKANINDEVDVYLRKVLGILNDSKMNINSIVSEFKKYGKKLNRVLSKASKVTAVYNANEIDNIKKLNKCLADLMVTIKATTDKSSISVIKRLMKAFTSQATIVGKIVEKKKKELPKAERKEVASSNKPVTESFSHMSDLFPDNYFV